MKLPEKIRKEESWEYASRARLCAISFIQKLDAMHPMFFKEVMTHFQRGADPGVCVAGLALICMS